MITAGITPFDVECLRKLPSVAYISAMIRKLLKGSIALVVILGFANAVSADDLIGQASIIDGDTLEIHGTRIRLWGVDAPEGTQLCRGEDSEQYRCGNEAANDLYAFIAHRLVNCSPINLDQYGRTVATCSVGGIDIGDCSCATAWRWTGRDTRVANTVRPSTTLSAPAGVFGKAATLSRGCTGFASGPVAVHPPVLTTRTTTPSLA